MVELSIFRIFVNKFQKTFNAEQLDNFHRVEELSHIESENDLTGEYV